MNILPQLLDFNRNNATFRFEPLQNMLPISTSGSFDASLLPEILHRFLLQILNKAVVLKVPAHSPPLSHLIIFSPCCHLLIFTNLHPLSSPHLALQSLRIRPFHESQCFHLNYKSTLKLLSQLIESNGN